MTENQLNDWWDRWIPNSPVSRNTEAYNHMREAFADLVSKTTTVSSVKPAKADSEVKDNA